MTKQHKRKLHSAAWSPAARKKRKATMAAKRAAREAGLTPQPELEHTIKFRGKLVRTRSTANDTSVDAMRDVIVFLEHAERAILKSGAKRISKAESYAMLALTTLRGG